MLELNDFVKLKHIYELKGFLMFSLKYFSPSLLDPPWIWIFDGSQEKPSATAPSLISSTRPECGYNPFSHTFTLFKFAQSQAI